MRAIPKRKHYLEFVTATLSIPVLATAILINIGNLQNDTTRKNTEPEKIIVTYAPREQAQAPQQPQQQVTTAPVTTEACDKSLGPVAISYPDEGDIVTDNPLDVEIKHDETGKYCAIVWSYRLNDGKWSDYDDKSLALYNVPNGPKTLEIRVKSVATGEEEILKRTFDYQGTEVQATITPTQVTVTPSGQ